MSRQPSKFDQMCREFELRMEKARLAKDRPAIKRDQASKTILLDENVMLVESSSPAKSGSKEVAKKEVQLLENVTSKLRNVPQNDEIYILDDETCLKTNTKFTNVDLNVQPPLAAISGTKTSEHERLDEELKKSVKSLKPENYRIQQVIKEEDLVYFDLETGGMGYKEDILQIGALNHEGKASL